MKIMIIFGIASSLVVLLGLLEVVFEKVPVLNKVMNKIIALMTK